MSPRYVQSVVDGLNKMYPSAHCELYHDTPLQLLVATILSAQCTDKRVNLVTPALFERFPDAQAFAKAPIGDLEELIRTTGFFRNKAKNIKACCTAIVEKHHGKVPSTMEELTALGGVGRKTANVVLGNAFGVPGMVVDTHVKRIAKLLGLTQNTDPVKVEQDLMKMIPQKEWTQFGHNLIFHGRRVCKARTPNCPECNLAPLCPSANVPG